jgi:small subunit ribosomal protein S9
MADKKNDKDKSKGNKPEVKVETKKSPRKAKPAEANSLQDLKDLASASAPQTVASLSKAEAQAAPIERVVKIDKLGRAYGTGRRKGAVARVWIKRGSGKVVVNDRDQVTYFARQTHRLILNQPFLVVNSVGHFDVICTVKGGGLSGQAGAVRHGISRALENFDPALRPALKKAGMLTRDSRVVERKKVGMHGARRTKQWAKR